MCFRTTFRVQICLVVSVVTIGIRNDFYAVVYSILLVVALMHNRAQQSLHWHKYVLALSVLFVVQYVFCVGLPGFFCLGLYNVHSG